MMNFMHQNKLKKLKDLFLLEEFKHLHHHDFFTDRLLIYSPLYLPDILKGLKFLEEALSSNKKIFVFGDRDVDGITSTTIITDYLISYRNHQSLIFKNSTEGDTYGISDKIIQEILEINPDLIIFLDMGSSHIHYLKQIVELNKKIIILDHHIPQIDDIPENDFKNIAFINPLMSNILLEHQNKISTAGITLKFILAYELYVTKVIHKIQIIKTNDYYIFQNGYYINKIKEWEQIEEYSINKKKYTLLKIKDFLPYFNTIPQSTFENLIHSNPIEFGKYITALSIELRPAILEIFMQYSSLAAIGLIADQVPLIGENRTIVKAGLGLLKHKPKFLEGFKALLQQLGLNPDALTSKDVGWNISPVINAAGRIGETEKAIDLLLEKNPIKAIEKASILIEFNNQRRERTKKNAQILENNNEHIEEENSYVLFYHEDLEPGVSGIMASRMAEKYQKPAIWINPEGEFAKGSVRSWGGINVLEMLSPIKDVFVDLGGHAEAVGFTIEYNKIPLLKEKLKEITAKYHKGLDNSYNTENKNYKEFSIKPEYLGEDLIQDLRLLEPFGPENPEIYFLLKSVKICDLEKFNDKHLKFKVIRALADIEFILWNAFPDILTEDFEELKKFRWDISGIFERNIFYPFYTNCRYRFYVKYIEQKDNIDDLLHF
ncbi:MAG: single-stranded-DNA-specific exonuclease RecJ [Leptospiraceae bacterium]|nr:MAG: single-stranded-DNA-specific exonuclease RecJ [Leptospiraceae bacterium]